MNSYAYQNKVSFESSQDDNNELKRLEARAIGLFTKQEHALISDYAYQEGLYKTENDPTAGSVFWSKLLQEEKNYYLIRDEASLIQSSAKALAEILPKHSCYIEIGPGSNEAIQSKTMPISSV